MLFILNFLTSYSASSTNTLNQYTEFMNKEFSQAEEKNHLKLSEIVQNQDVKLNDFCTRLRERIRQKTSQDIEVVVNKYCEEDFHIFCLLSFVLYHLDKNTSLKQFKKLKKSYRQKSDRVVGLLSTMMEKTDQKQKEIGYQKFKRYINQEDKSSIEFKKIMKKRLDDKLKLQYKGAKEKCKILCDTLDKFIEGEFLSEYICNYLGQMLVEQYDFYKVLTATLIEMKENERT